MTKKNQIVNIHEIDVADFDASLLSDDVEITITVGTKQGQFKCKDRKTFIEDIQPDSKKRRYSGRYTLMEAALLLERHAGADPDVMIKKLKSAVSNDVVHVYAPNKHDIYIPDQLEEGSHEVYWDDLNQWLKQNEKRIAWTFPEPRSTTSSAAKSGHSVKGVTRKSILVVDWPLIDANFNKASFSRALSDVPKWLKDARIAKSTAGRGSSLWNPALMALALHERKYANKSALTTLIRNHFSEWLDEWNGYY